MSRFSASFFAGNRSRLLGALPDGAVVAVAGHTEMQRQHDMAYEFEQEASFWYLSGISAPDWVLLIEADKTILVTPTITSSQQIFDGSLSTDDARRISGADKVITLNELPSFFERWVQRGADVYTLLPDRYLKKYAHFALNPAPAAMVRKLKKARLSVKDCRPHVQKLRTIKQAPEIAAITAAVDITAEAFAAVQAGLSGLSYEFEAEAVMTHAIRRRGASGHAYTPIIAAGLNACTLHYVRNDAPLRADELLLIDVGARVDGYAADVTRTLAVRPTKRQSQVYAAVKEAQAACLQLIRPGCSFADYQTKTDEIMRRAVASLGLSEARWREYFPHAIGHGLGIDVHDSLAGYQELRPGMVLTVEPGIYIPEESIGVRIEDDIVVTEDAHDNLSERIDRSLQ